MFILAGKLFLWLSCFIFIHSNHNTTTLAQPDFISYFCENAANYTKSSKYQSSLNNTLHTLPLANRGLGFYKLPLGKDNDKVYSVALCRGDVNSDVCDRCVKDSIVKLPQFCPNQKAAIGYYDYCFLSYSNKILLNNPQLKFNVYVSLANTHNATDIDGFNGTLGSLLRELRGYAAAAGPLGKFATGNMSGPNFFTIYGLMQCIPDLSEQQCSDCLEDIIDRIALYFNGKVGGRILLPMCNFRYETHRFFNESSDLVISPPPPPPPILQPAPSTPKPITPAPDQRISVSRFHSPLVVMHVIKKPNNPSCFCSVRVSDTISGEYRQTKRCWYCPAVVGGFTVVHGGGGSAVPPL